VWACGGLLHRAHLHPGNQPRVDNYLTTPLDYINDSRSSPTIVLGVICLIGVRRPLQWPTAAVVLASVGQILVGIGVAAGLVTRSSQDWLVLVGLPGDLLAAIGYLLLAVWAWHRRRCRGGWPQLSGSIAVPVGIGVAEFGRCIVRPWHGARSESGCGGPRPENGGDWHR
jgi:hypothetical protein